jgi:hypothetical protein
LWIRSQLFVLDYLSGAVFGIFGSILQLVAGGKLREE